MAKCVACGRFASTVDGVKCTKCEGFYHRPCVKILQEARVASWLCPECKAGTPRKDNSDKPVRGEGTDYVPGSEVSTKSDKVDELLHQMQLLHEEMKSFRGDFNVMRDEMISLKSNMENFGGRIDGLEDRLVGLENKVAELQARPDTTELLTTIERLKVELNDRDQEAFHNDIEISGIPEEQGENVSHLVGLIAGKLGVVCEQRDFVCVERGWVRRAAGGEGAARPRPVVVRLARRQLRDELLQAARVRRHATTEGLGLSAEPRRFYVNERLSRYNKRLFYKVREECQRHGWKYAWTRGGRIYIRREQGKGLFQVRSDDDMPKIFGTHTVGIQSNQNLEVTM